MQYDAAALDHATGAHRDFQIAFLGGLLVLLLAAAVPLKHVRLASNLLVLASSLFIATQLVMIYRPAVNPVLIASPLAEEWLVVQGGHAELYHHVTSTQRDALGILGRADRILQLIIVGLKRPAAGQEHSVDRSELTKPSEVDRAHGG